MSDLGVNESGSPAREELCFGRFRLAGPNGPLRSSDEVIELPRKPLALLWTLARRGGDVVTKEELLATVWPGAVVTEGVISACLRDLRRALGDDARNPTFIATAHRIGYRFIAPVSADGGPVGRSTATSVTADMIAGRGSELARLHACFAKALSGQRQLVFVTGEAGIGKSRLVDCFVASLPACAPASNGRTRAGASVGHGQCIEHYGEGEPYLPILEAVTRLCRTPGGQALLAKLRQHAPTWLAQLPGLVDDAERDALQRQAGTGSQQRMLREMAEALDAVALEQPLVLVLEDMHWSDRSTVDWLAMQARRRERAQLLVVATCRPVELIVHAHPLKQVKQDLLARSAATEIALGYLAVGEVLAYVVQRLPHLPEAQTLAQLVYRRSQGHPLFMVHMTDDLAQADAVTAADDLGAAALPCGVGDLIQAQLARLSPEQQAVLEAASVAGAEFCAASVAAALQLGSDSVERLLETLADQQQFVEARGLAEWHDGTVSGCYGFRHDMYREGLYRRLGRARRARLHALVGERLATAYGAHGADVAAELALHFENARDAQRAAHHCREAGEKALHRYANREALTHAGKGLALLESAAAGPDRGPAELGLLLVQGAALLATRGYGATEVETTYARALALGVELNDTASIGPALSGLYNLYLTRASFKRVREIADQVLAAVRRRPEPALSMLAHNVHGTALLFSGEAAACLVHVDRCLALYDPPAHRLLAVTYGEDPAVAAHHYAALARWITGCPESAERHLGEGFRLARSLAQPFGEAQMFWMEAVIRLDDGDFESADAATRRLNDICAEHGFALWLAGGQILRGCVLAARGEHDAGRALTHRGLQSWRGDGTLLTLPHALSVAARVEARTGRVEHALALLEEALATARRTGERWYEPELLRLHGETILTSAADGADRMARAQAAFEGAVDLARGQGSRLLELRACTSLASSWVDQGRTEQARALLTQARAGFSEGLHSRDMERAAALLAGLATTQSPAPAG